MSLLRFKEDEIKDQDNKTPIVEETSDQSVVPEDQKEGHRLDSEENDILSNSISVDATQAIRNVIRILEDIISK